MIFRRQLHLLIPTAACVLLVQTIAAQPQTFDPNKSDKEAIEVVKNLWQTLGGKENWDQLGYLSFHWLVERDGQDVADFRHDWDRQTNRYRVEGTNRDGEHFVVLFDTQSKEGTCHLEGTKVETDSTNQQMLEYAYGRYINDSYWLVMPFKLMDPGVILKYEGTTELDNVQHDVVRVTFEKVGLTPGDTYWLYIDPAHLVSKWEYHLEGWEADKERTVAWWRQWQPVGGLKLATSKEFEGGKARIYFKNVVGAEGAPEDVFENTEKTF